MAIQLVNQPINAEMIGIDEIAIDMSYNIKPYKYNLIGFWERRWVSNPRPTVPQTVALTY